MLSEGHLTLSEVALSPGREWRFDRAGCAFVRVGEGIGYWLGKNMTKEIGTGDVIVCTARNGAFRASQIGGARLQVFSVEPGKLAGLLTPIEIQRLEVSFNKTTEPIRIATAVEPLAVDYKQLSELPEEGARELVRRGQMLRLAAACFAEQLPQVDAAPAPGLFAKDRFREVIGRLPAAEIAEKSPVELAGECGCSQRHFNRLFQEQFGESFRAWTMKLRIQKAQRLLAATNGKIIDVAMESGFRHLSLFNAVFKSHSGMTPGQWRRQAMQKKRRFTAARGASLLLLLAMVLSGAFLLAAPARVNAADPATTNAAPRNPTFEVRSYDVVGNTIFPSEDIEKIMSDHTGKAVDFETIRKALAELQLAYRGRGYVTVSVSLPPQQLTNGVVKVQVTEGRLADIILSGNRHFSSNNIMSALPCLRTNMLLNNLVFQQELDRANANRDRQVYPQIGPGPEPGTSALTLKVKDRLPLHGRLELNNYSTPGTPIFRLNSSVQYNNLWQLDHQAGLQYSCSPEQVKTENFLPYQFFDQPLIASYSMFYRAPLSFGGVESRRREYTVGDFGYDEVTKRFRPPPLAGGAEMIFYASRSASDTGILITTNTFTDTSTSTFVDRTFQQNLTYNENLGARIVCPLPDLGRIRSTLSFGPDFKSYRLVHFETNNIYTEFKSPPNATNPPPVDIRNAIPLQQPVYTRVDYLPFTLGWDASEMDKFGATTLSVNQTVHLAALLGGNGKVADEFRNAAYSREASGNYYLLSASLNREQRIYEEWVLRLHADGQWASQPLLSNEQFGLGGAAGVRGYQDGQEYGDTGWRVLAEQRTPLVDVGLVDGTAPMYLRGYVFTDYGQRNLLAAPAGRSPSLGLWGAGLGGSMQVGERVDARFYCAWPLLEIPGVISALGRPRLSLAVAVQF